MKVVIWLKPRRKATSRAHQARPALPAQSDPPVRPVHQVRVSLGRKVNLARRERLDRPEPPELLANRALQDHKVWKVQWGRRGRRVLLVQPEAMVHVARLAPPDHVASRGSTERWDLAG